MPYEIRRHVHSRITDALADTRIVTVLGARQVGKSTLTREIATHDHPAQIVSLDDRTLREAANADPAGFLAAYGGQPLLLDEIQRVPDLLLEIKDVVDADTRPGQFLLTGSANILTAPKIAEALTGRTEFISLWPFSQAELAQNETNLVDVIFRGRAPMITAAPVGRAAYAEIISRGGYPEARIRPRARRRRWYESYIKALVERDLREITDAAKLEYVPRLLRLVAAQAANLFVPANVSKVLSLDRKTVVSYTKLLETTFIVRRMQAWTPGIGSRETQHEKIYIVDSGLMAYLVGATEQRVADDDRVAGRIFENFVAMEVARLVDWAETPVIQYHYRYRDRDEVDVVLESHSGELVGIEVKAAASLSSADYSGLAKLRDARRSDFVIGIVLYAGAETKPLGDRLWAVPVNALWER